MLEHTCSQRAVAGSSSVSMKQGADVQHETHVQHKMQRAEIIISCGQVFNMHKDIYNNSENQQLDVMWTAESWLHISHWESTWSWTWPFATKLAGDTGVKRCVAPSDRTHSQLFLDPVHMYFLKLSPFYEFWPSVHTFTVFQSKKNASSAYSRVHVKQSLFGKWWRVTSIHACCILLSIRRCDGVESKVKNYVSNNCK